VEAIKRIAKLNGAATVAAAAGIGVALGAVGLLWQSPISAQTAVMSLLTGLLGGLGAVGLDVGGRSATGKAV